MLRRAKPFSESLATTYKLTLIYLYFLCSDPELQKLVSVCEPAREQG